MKPATLQSIADACGTNRMTVSLALRGRGGVSAETKARVLAEAGRQGYKPNPLVSALMARLREARTPRYQATLALIHAAPAADWREMFPACRRFDLGLRNRTAQLGYGLETFWLRSRKWAGGGLARALKGRGIHGVVVAPLPGGTHDLDFDFSGFASAAIGQSLHRPALHSAGPNYFQTIELAFVRLREAGRKRIGLLLDPDHDERSQHQWLAAFLGCQMAANGAAGKVKPLIKNVDAAGLLAWTRREKLDALMSADTRHLDWLRAARIRVPGDTAYACFTHAPEMRGVSGVANNPAEIAMAAVDMVIAQLHRNERGLPAEPRILQLTPRWVAGETV